MEKIQNVLKLFVDKILFLIVYFFLIASYQIFLSCKILLNKSFFAREKVALKLCPIQFLEINYNVKY